MSKTYFKKISEPMRKFYSLNFLLAELEEITDPIRDKVIIDSRISCEKFHTNDFKTRAFYKNISTPLNFDSHDTN